MTSLRRLQLYFLPKQEKQETVLEMDPARLNKYRLEMLYQKLDKLFKENLNQQHLSPITCLSDMQNQLKYW